MELRPPSLLFCEQGCFGSGVESFQTRAHAVKLLTESLVPTRRVFPAHVLLSCAPFRVAWQHVSVDGPRDPVKRCAR